MPVQWQETMRRDVGGLAVPCFRLWLACLVVIFNGEDSGLSEFESTRESLYACHSAPRGVTVDITTNPEQTMADVQRG
jgi:hypothetical protein